MVRSTARSCLQLSGVGDWEHLSGLGIDVVSDLPGVGENLQDHLEVYIQHRCTEPVSMQPYNKNWRKPFIGLQWLFRRGPAATNHFEAGAFVRSNDEVQYPNLMFHFLPIAIRYDGSEPEGGHGYQVHVGPMYSDVRGAVKIRSTDPREHPAVQFNYLSTENDRKEWVEAVRTTRLIMSQPAFDPYNGGGGVTGAGGRDGRGDSRLDPSGCRDGPAPVLHGQDGSRRPTPWPLSTRTPFWSTAPKACMSSMHRCSPR